MRHPTLKLLRLRLTTAHNELVQARFTDNERRTTRLIPNLRITEVCDFVIIKSFTEMIRVNAEYVAYVFGDEPRFPRFVGSPQKKNGYRSTQPLTPARRKEDFTRYITSLEA